MRILFYQPTATQRRFIPFEAIKGSAFFRRPHYDAMRLSYLSKDHDFLYYDENIEEQPDFVPDLLIVTIPLNLARYVESTVRKRWNKAKIISCGIFPTLFPQRTKKFSDAVVCGDIASVWEKIIADYQHKNLAHVYTSYDSREFNVDRRLETKYGFTPVFSQLRTSFGCHCHPKQKHYCADRVLYKHSKRWHISKVVDEVSHIKRKVIFVLDDDFLSNVDVAIKMLEKCWRYKKMWIFQTTSNIFNHTHVLPLLRDDGVRIIYLKEDWLGLDLVNSMSNKNFRKNKEHQVSLIHNYRIAVGAKVRLGFEGEDYKFYKKLLKFLVGIKVDLIEIATQTPMPKSNVYNHYEKTGQIVKDLTLYDQWMPVVRTAGVNPQALYSWMEWLRDRFYSWDSILLRNVVVSPKLGFYNTAFFYLIPNLSYRNNFLERVGYPP
jgi:hypothetical protein